MKKIISFFLIATLTSVCTNIFAQKTNLTLNDIFTKGVFAAKSFDGFTSLKNGTQYLQSEPDSVNKTVNLNLYDFKTGNFVKNFIKGADITLDGKTITLSNFKLSEDETKLLLWNGTEKIYRHSSKSNYFVYDIMEKKVIDLSISERCNCVSYHLMATGLLMCAKIICMCAS